MNKEEHIQNVAIAEADNKSSKRRRFSKPALVKSITLKSCQSQRLFEHLFKRVNANLYEVTKVLRLQGRVRDAYENEKVLDHLFLTAESEIALTIQALSQEVARFEEMKDGGSLVYDLEKRVQCNCFTGYSVRMLAIFSQFDLVVALVDTLEISGKLSHSYAASTIRSWDKRLRTFCQTVSELRNRHHSQEVVKEVEDD